MMSLARREMLREDRDSITTANVTLTWSVRPGYLSVCHLCDFAPPRVINGISAERVQP